MKDLKKTIHIKVPREEVYNAITNPLTIELWSGYQTVMDNRPDTEFSMFDGDITGRIKTLESPSLLEQIWDFGDQEAESHVRIELFEEKGKTRIELNHSNIPDDAFENIEIGWKEYYLGALKTYLET
ncbi:MAG TPA: ATPase [Bacteroides sp.]|nr:ATPase [Bacteroides sp.]